MSENVESLDGTALNPHDWSIPEPKAMVAFIHGYAEHGGRYAHLAERFNARGIGLYGTDLRGHGRSAGVRGYVDRFEDYFADVEAIMRGAESRSAGAPVFLFAHSMGGLIALDWLQRSDRSERIRGAVISSPFLGVAVEVGAAKAFAGRIADRWLPKLALATGLSGRDCCRDPEIADRYDNDPLIFGNATARWFSEIKRAMGRVGEAADRIRLPMLLLYAGDDRLVSADVTDRFAKGLLGPDQESERLAGLYHEIINEPPETRHRIMDRMIDWILAHAE